MNGLRIVGRVSIVAIASGLVWIAVGASASKKAPHYHELARFSVPGDGGWDYLNVDPRSHHLFISRGTHVMVIDTETHQVAGDIADTSGVHGIALAPRLNRGFTSNGRDNSVTIFDLSSLKTIAKVPVSGQGPDCIIYEPQTKEVFTFNGRTSNSSVLDAQTGKELGTIDLGGRPEYAQADGKGGVFVNIEDKSEEVAIDAKTMKVVRRWSLAPGEGPSGLAIDPRGRRTFSVTDGKMIVSDIDSGKVVATPEIGNGPDAAGFDSQLRLAFSSNGESGTLTVVQQNSPDSYTVLDNIKTEPGARTMTVDPSTHRVYLVTAKFAAPQGGQQAGQRQRRQMTPGSFTVLVYGP